MTNPERDKQDRPLRILRRRQDDSNAMLGIIMAGIAALFIVGIVVAYNYTSDSQVAKTPNPPSTSSAGAPATTGANRPSETTGSGNAAAPAPQAPAQPQQQR